MSMNFDHTRAPTPSAPDEIMLRDAVLAALPVLFGRAAQLPAVVKSETNGFPSLEAMDTEAFRIKFAIMRRVNLNQVIVEDADNRGLTILRKAKSCNADIIKNINSYVLFFVRIGVAPAEVEPYIRRERRLLASLYLEACKPMPSPHQLKQFAYQLAIDVRSTVKDDLATIQCIQKADDWRLIIYPTIAHIVLSLPSHGSEIVELSPLASEVLECISPVQANLHRLVNWIESFFGGAPTSQDSLEFIDTRELTYEINGGKLRLWKGSDEVSGISPKDEQAVLRYFCENANANLSGAELKRLSGIPITNPSQAVRRINKALKSDPSDGGNWLLTNPIRWADGVQIRCRD